MVRLKRLRSNSTVVFKLDGEAITLRTMKEIKETAEEITDQEVADVEAVYT